MGITQISMEIPVIVLRSGVIFPMEKAVEGEGLGGAGCWDSKARGFPAKPTPVSRGRDPASVPRKTATKTWG